MGFPPKSGGNSKPLQVAESATISTGKGGLKNSIALKNAGIKQSPGVEKVNGAS